MSARPKPRCDDVFAWLRLRLGQTALAPLTGTTGRALRAYVHLLDAWCSSRSESVEAALRATLAILQPSEWELAAWAIVAVGDWGFVADLWPRIKPPGAPNWIADGSIPPHEGGEHWGALIEIAGRRELSEGLATDGFSQVWSQLVELQNDAIVVPATFRSQFNAPASEVDNVLLEAVKLGLLVPVYRLKAEDDVLEELGQSDWTSDLAMLARVFDTTERGLVVDGTKPENIRVAFRRVRARGPA